MQNQVYKQPKKRGPQAARLPLTEDQRAAQRANASCCIVVKFRTAYTTPDGRSVQTLKKWSNEWAQPNLGGFDDWQRELKRIFGVYWAAKAEQAAIFDVRFNKEIIGSERALDCNKIWQFERGAWRAVKNGN